MNTASMSGPKKILVAMSGGTDSSVAAALLKEQGHELIGVTLHLWDAEGENKVGRCCAPEDREDARRVCDALGMPHYVIDERAAFRDDVVAPFVKSYLHGQTPSPCVSCNRSVKLEKLVGLARALGASHIATGHYARVVQGPTGPRLLRGRDEDKDQSYFLFGVSPEVLSMLVFPLGDLQKDETREHGRRLGVHNADKPDSQELCFVPDGRIGEFVEREAQGDAMRTGVFRDTEGNSVASHSGIHQFTIGQRRGLGLSGSEKPKYVLKILPDTGDVVVGDETRLYSNVVEVQGVTWNHGAHVASRPVGEEFDAEIRIRYKHRAASARLTLTDKGFKARFTSPQRAITPGQAAVVYRGDEVLGGGFIVP